MKENSDSNDINVGSIGNSIEKDIKIINNFITYFNKNIQNGNKADLTVLGEEINAIEHILSDYKRVLKENEIYKKNSEIMSKENLSTAEQLKVEIKENFRLKNELETKRKEYQETYKDVREELKELRKENEELNNRCRNLDKEAQAYLEELAGDNTLTRRTIKQLQEENEELKNNTRKNENELEFDIDCDWIALQKMLDESEKSNEYISYKNEKWIKEKYCIPIQKIKDKIEELNKKVKDYQCVENRINLYQRKVLQELLEESEE